MLRTIIEEPDGGYWSWVLATNSRIFREVTGNLAMGQPEWRILFGNEGGMSRPPMKLPGWWQVCGDSNVACD